MQAIRNLLFLVLLAVLAGCSTLKGIEGKAYDLTADGASRYCAGLATDDPALARLALRERTELRREIRQRGTGGPAPAEVPGLDAQTAGASGPVAVIYCEGDQVPPEVWARFVRTAE